MKREQIELMFLSIVVAILVRASYELTKPKQTKGALFLAEKQSAAGTSDQYPITARQKEWAEKAVKRFAEAQEKNWRNWNEAMFEAD